MHLFEVFRTDVFQFRMGGRAFFALLSAVTVPQDRFECLWEMFKCLAFLFSRYMLRDVLEG